MAVFLLSGAAPSWLVGEVVDASGLRDEFVVVNGEAAGRRIRIPHGTTTIGSGEGSRLRLPVSGVSRRHAVLTSLDGRTVVEDQNSRNGTWVNGHPITAPTELTDGDEVQFGQVLLRFIEGTYDGGSGPPHAAGGHDSRQRAPAAAPKKGLGAALLFAAAINVVGLIGNSLTAFLTDLTPTWTWFVTPAMGLAVALGGETLSYLKDKGAKAPKRPVRPYHPSSQRQPSRPPRPLRPGRPEQTAPRSRPIVVTLIATLLLLGGGGWLVAAGVSYAVGYFSGNEEGTQRLARQVVTEAQGVTVTVLGVQSTDHFTRVEIHVRNGTSNSMSLPLFHNAILTGPDGTTFDADSFRSSWQPEIPPGGQRRGTINFESQLPDTGGMVSLSFVTVFLQGFDGPRSITVPDIELMPLVVPIAETRVE
ncbi:FHA domain-containing protein [Arthrobacter sp. B10-11]|uniref:FHA domain-containing protein n=1 Tax=Arthrobacter sp. B10-11 TaxID=3081160 RepID=UPI002953C37D|nr:FHA domain-containing protein [Arthrobacter sp. B10-11]MDV8149751.1 FHA domain-containing protein [Arthrobacter sp. B10-11]